jgi:8-oxo-dGTP diphosphatase
MNVAIAIIKQDQAILITRRGQSAHLPFFWEFPGGKQEQGETLEECLKREVMEELSLEIRIGHLYGKIEYTYSDRTVTLYPYLCSLLRSPPVSTETVKWVLPEALSLYHFPEANRPLLLVLMEGRLSL